MAFRLLRICSTPELFNLRLDELKNDVLIPRNYKVSVIENAFERVKLITREESLKKIVRDEKNKKKEERVIVPIDYNPRIPPPGAIMKKHHKAMIRKNSSLKEIFPSEPMPALRQGPNLRRLICRAKLHQKPTGRPKRATQVAPGWKPCAGNKGPCPICPYTAPHTTEVVGQVSGYQHIIKDAVNCQDENVIYQWKCIKTNCPQHPRTEYEGKITQSFQQRFSQHRDYVKRGIVTEASGEHFSLPGHSVADMQGLVLEKVKSKDPFVLKAREHFFIQKFDSYRKGLNRER